MSVAATYTSLIENTDDIASLIELLSSYRNKIKWARNSIKCNNADIKKLQEENERLKKEYYTEMDTKSIEYLIKEKIADLVIDEVEQ